MKQFNIIQQEINLLVRQAELVAKLEEKKIKYIESNDRDMVNIIDEQLNIVYPSYLELREKYLTKE